MPTTKIEEKMTGANPHKGQRSQYRCFETYRRKRTANDNRETTSLSPEESPREAASTALSTNPAAVISAVRTMPAMPPRYTT